MDVISTFNKIPTDEFQSLIRKGLSSATGVAEALIPQSLEKRITNTIIRLSPELAFIKTKFDRAKYHEFNQLTGLPDVTVGAMGETATTPVTQSSTVRTGVNLKVIRRKGVVSGFIQDASGNYIDALKYEMENQLVAHVYHMVNTLLYGNAAANSWEFSGWDYYISTNRKNGARFGDTPASLKFLDDMIDASNTKGAMRHDRVFIMSPYMLSKISQLQTNVRYNIDQAASGTLAPYSGNLPGGWRLQSYRDIPIIESSNVRPQATMTALTPGTAGSGGHIADSTTYYFAVAPVTLNGEELPARTSQATGAPGSAVNTITVAFTAFTGALRYRIYCSTTQYSELLVLEVPAWTYDSNGTPTGKINSITFTTNPAAANPTFTATDGTVVLTGVTASVPTGMQSDIPLEQDTGHSPAEVVGLIDLDEIQGLGKMVYSNSGGSDFNGLISKMDLYPIDDNFSFLIKSYAALVPSWESTSYWYRGVRVS